MQWNKWYPAPLVHGKYEIKDMQGNLEKLEIRLSQPNTNYNLRITFEFILIAYQYTDITWRKKFVEVFKTQTGDHYSDWTFFTINNSPYIKWLLSQSCNVNQPNDFIHYAIVTPTCILDIASWGIPDTPKIDGVKS